MLGETIVAIATAEGCGGIAVVRLSGIDAVAIANRVFSPGIGPKSDSHRAVYGILSAANDDKTSNNTPGDPIDQVIALPMFSPNSFTGDDTVEFFCHGGTVVSRLVMAACRGAGARPATAGEFTRRAFLNGKMSLDQAEAVADLIHAESELAARGAIRQLLGGLNYQLVEIEKPLLKLLSNLEGGLEFLDDEVPQMDRIELINVLQNSVDGISGLLDLAPAGKFLRDGIHVVLQGEPNVGKSSLFNNLVGSDRAIVDDEAGTTRDVVTARVVRNGRIFVFHDTAGLRETAGRVEQKGIERTRNAVRDADIVLSLRSAHGHSFDHNNSLGQSSFKMFVSVLTKCDLVDQQSISQLDPSIICTSSLDSSGMDLLWNKMDEMVETYDLQKAVSLGVVINERHRHKLETSQSELVLLLEELNCESAFMGDEVVGTLLASILSQLGEISGRVFSEQLLGSVFSRFCIGK